MTSPPTTTAHPGHLRRELRGLLDATRGRTLRLCGDLDEEVVHRQPIDFLSPVVWDLGHIAVFEELWLLRRLAGRAPTDPRLDDLYDAFEQPRWVRGELPLLEAPQAQAFLADVHDDVLAELDTTEFDPHEPLVADGALHRMLVQHESQHQETILQSLQLREDVGPLALPSLGLRDGRTSQWRPVDDTERVAVPGGGCVVGTDEGGWTYDNERPAHRVELASFALDRFPVTARRYAEFVAAGGYEQPRWWSARGWSWQRETGHRAPQAWQRDRDGQWCVRRLGRLVPLAPEEPVQHVSWFEAEAFSAWAGGRLPTELEWEKAARWDPASGRARRFPWGDAPWTPAHANVGLRRAGPAPVGSYPAGASAYGAEQLAGDVYEWTSSPFEGYPGFTAFPYREYSEVFFGGQDYRVLRGSSWAIAAPFARATYRNWDHPYRRQLMAGFRVAYDVPAGD